MLGKFSVAAALAAMVSAAPALAQQNGAPPGPPPSWESLIPCAQKADAAEGFRCYQAAMRAAGYSPNPATVAADRRKTFGLSLPSFHGHKAEPGAEAKSARAERHGSAAAPAPAAEETDENRVSVTLERVALMPPLNRLLIVTSEGAIWEQTDNETVAPLPKPGQQMTVLKGAIDGFFCQFDKRTRVRCRRTH